MACILTRTLGLRLGPILSLSLSLRLCLKGIADERKVPMHSAITACVKMMNHKKLAWVSRLRHLGAACRHQADEPSTQVVDKWTFRQPSVSVAQQPYDLLRHGLMQVLVAACPIVGGTGVRADAKQLLQSVHLLLAARRALSDAEPQRQEGILKLALAAGLYRGQCMESCFRVRRLTV
eukprot:CAMPEP_0174757790 /NCGR_PEP_ID=MMETSP1094-20130205/107432_1 /TAXON_ID=156173 /ORGANISM="Chrysochromulina brevifilum, Strain UTEX LB 985" /LENGTH=177 /DNA_ID=CAMNT_0015963705 /DNA_START=2313 /DNA_END=2848 /DNA_ORIENTATION=+